MRTGFCPAEPQERGGGAVLPFCNFSSGFAPPVRSDRRRGRLWPFTFRREMCGGALPLVSRSAAGIVSRSAGKPWRSVRHLGSWPFRPPCIERSGTRYCKYPAPSLAGSTTPNGAQSVQEKTDISLKSARWPQEGRRAASGASPRVYLSRTATGGYNHRWGAGGA